MLLWCAATAGATALVQGGVGTIRAATRRDTVVDVQAVAVDTVGTWSTTSSAPAPAASTTTDPRTGPRNPVSSGVPAPTPTPAPTRPPAGATTTVASPPGTVPPVVASPATTTSPPATAVTRTVTTRGGTATIRFRPDDVAVVAATPNAGFAVKVDQRGAGAVRVEFERADAQSRIDAWWDAEPRVEVREG